MTRLQSHLDVVKCFLTANIEFECQVIVGFSVTELFTRDAVVSTVTKSLDVVVDMWRIQETGLQGETCWDFHRSKAV